MILVVKTKNRIATYADPVCVPAELLHCNLVALVQVADI